MTRKWLLTGDSWVRRRRRNSLGGVYNVVGITIGVFVVVYPFPRLVQLVNPKSTTE